MSFQAYLKNIKAKTGKTHEDFRKLAEAKGFLMPGVKAGPIVARLKEDFGLRSAQVRCRRLAIGRTEPRGRHP